ncbi:acetyl-CoA acetyltransferase [Pigmentiphaga sp. GD03639]|uniref:Acetyl-CoA acetyltransferase n=1 Tax=Pigmentiphaga daeguensis TaxID=414049 RepID=A0ABP3LV27_9BURK|nr:MULTISPECIES: acetyl-CoA acetyltransferase [unclassified Pigmentiphaga]MDH2236222.1 acetyl-CoA acetyltransferase [Pigmentiphaga sp. GD03639]OVZ58243.1 acetyl-CoA acetyltransferase [Pigmentiphaga sp. NML030171]
MDTPCIVGWGHTPFGRLDHFDLEGLMVESTRLALADAGLRARDVDAVFVSHFNAGMVPDGFPSSLPFGADDDFRFTPTVRLENACASGSAAIHAALDAIGSGRVRVALVVGAEKMTAADGPAVTAALARASHHREEGSRGLTFPGIFALIAREYFARHGDHGATLARIAAKNHANGARNPLAHLRRDLGFDFCNTVSERNPIIAAPLRKTDCSTVADGAAALVLTAAPLARDFRRAVRFRSTVQVNDFLPMSRRDPVAFEGPRRAWRRALDEAGIGIRDLDLAEVHDCFTIAELLSYEAMGLAEAGQGARCVDDGTVAPGGALPVNPSGGLKAKGHPVGATGVSMHVMAAMQLCGEAGDIQVPGAELAGVFNMGGSVVANYVSVLERAA